MSPLQESRIAEWVMHENDPAPDKTVALAPSADNRKMKIVWKNVFLLTLLHLGSIHGFYLLLTRAMWQTMLFHVFLIICSGLGITAGAHRLWSHRAYKAKLPLRVLLTFLNTMAVQDPVLDWARDHRMHHKYSETDADPYNATRGFFFSHMGWLMVKKHQQIKAKGHNIDMSDLWADPVLRFQKKYYIPLAMLASFVIPAIIPTYWGETMWNAFFVCSLWRYIFVLHGTWSVNSVAHMFGNKPYDQFISPVENKTVSFIALGEGYHNYHHTFPWDYQTAELGSSLNTTKVFIDYMAKIGWAYDLKTVSRRIIENRISKTGDGSHKRSSYTIKY